MSFEVSFPKPGVYQGRKESQKNGRVMAIPFVTRNTEL